MHKFLTGLIFAGLLLVLTACEKSTAEILEKADNVETVEQLKDKLGDPDKIDKVGPVANWTYKASDGSVTFTIVGDQVTVSSAKSKE